MTIAALDWVIIGAYFAGALGIGLYYSRRAGKNVTEFFGAGRSLPWWLAGTSMVATTFSADTPLAVTELVARHGVAGNWLWWNMVFSGVLTVFFYARLWRRVGVLTDIEFTEIRYGGRPAAFLRGFRALYLGTLINAVIMGWVISAMGTIVGLSLGIPRWTAIAACLLLTAVYSGMSGLWGVVVTDFFQFGMAMTGSILLAVYGLDAVGGVAGVREGLTALTGSAAEADSFLSMMPPVGKAWLPPMLFFTYIGVQWWASWYPGAEPGGGGYIAQRMFSAKDERHSLLATLWFNVAHYGLRPWPWILTALVAVVMFPALADLGARATGESAGEVRVIRQTDDFVITSERTDKGYQLTHRDLKSPGGQPIVKNITEPRQTYVALMMMYLPPGVLGLFLAAMAAAFMSTISTHINWGTSYVVNDFYKRFVKKDANDAHYVSVSRWVSVLMMGLGGLVGVVMQSQIGGWELLLTIGAGTGLVYILRWFWWRVNAWSEIAAMAAALVVSLALKVLVGAKVLVFPENAAFAYELLITVDLTTAVWLAATLVSRPEKQEVLAEFVRRARPAGPGWKPVRQKMAQPAPSSDDLFYSFLDWLAGCALIYCALFGVGELILGNTGLGFLLLSAATAGAGFIYWDLSRRGWEKVAE